MTKVYPVVLTPTTDGYVVTVPDLDINTQGSDLAEAIYMARDAIGLWGISEQDDGRAVPEPSIDEPGHEPGELVSWVDVDFDHERRRYNKHMVKKTLTIPAGLNYEGERAGVNFSSLLQQALREELNMPK